MNVIVDIWRSFRALPLWVQIWVAVVLVPINLAGVFFWGEAVGRIGAVLGILGMAPNMYFMISERGFSKIMALPHLLPWTVQVVWLLVIMTGDAPALGVAAAYAWGLIAVNTISLFFDYRDAVDWWRGDRAPVRK